MKHVISNLNGKGIANVVLNRPDLHNAFNEQLISELTEAFENLSANDNVRLIVLSGEGKSFCAGADINWMGKMKSASQEENLNDARALAQMFKTINDTPKTVIGVVQGTAIGGGVGLTAVCDYVLCAAGAQFALSEVRLGLVPATIAPYVVKKIGESHARALFLSGEAFGAERALHINLIHEIVPGNNINYRLQEVVVNFLKAGPQASKYAKKLIADLHHPDIIEYTAQLIAYLRASPEGQEGMDAHLSKKTPGWHQR